MERVWIAGGTGYIGRATVAAAREAGLCPVVLTRHTGRAEALRAQGVDAVVGDLLDPTTRVTVEADLAIFVAAPPSWGQRVSRRVAQRFSSGLLDMTRRFLDSAEGRSPQRIVVVAGTSFFGDAGPDAPRDESFAGTPKGWGPYLAPTVAEVEARARGGAPIVLAFPGQVYGPASWMAQLFLEPLAAGRTVVGLSGHDPMFSPIHLDDCGRALTHLARRGEPGARYLLVDDQPVRVSAFVEEVARALGQGLRTRTLPRWLCSLLIGPVLTEYATVHTHFSNARLRSTGFEFRFPTWRDGVPDIVARWRARDIDPAVGEGLRNGARPLDPSG